MENIQVTQIKLITDSEGNLIMDDTKEMVLVENLDQPGTLMFINHNDLPSSSNSPSSSPSNMEQHHCGPDNLEAADNEKTRNLWSLNEILNLLAAYRKHNQLMRTSGVTKERVWSLIATDVKTHSAIQCSNKFKYLKGLYIKKKENMGSKATGEKRIKFEYLEEFDEIFGKDPTIVPMALASSSRGTENMPNENEIVKEKEDNAPETTPKTPKRKGAIPVNKENKKSRRVEELRVSLSEREENKQRRHEENLQVKRDALDAFKMYMEKLLEK